MKALEKPHKLETRGGQNLFQIALAYVKKYG